MRKCVFLLALAVLCATGCANRNKQLTKVMESWMGHDIKEVIESWGPPSTVYDEAELKVYVWNSQSSFTLPGRTSGKTVYPGQTITRNHYRMFWVNQDGKVVRWKFGTQ